MNQLKRCACLLVYLLLSSVAVAETEIVEVDRPWSGHWWPMTEGENVLGYGKRGLPSPVGKFDACFDLKGEAYWWEYNHHYKPDGESWEGHCNGWAVAAISEPEPVAAVNRDGYTFFVGDQKALWSIYYQGAGGTLYGEPVEGIDPLTFHDTLQTYLRDNDLPVLMEEDPSDEVWNYPIFRYRMDWTDDGNTRHVTTTVRVAWNTGIDPDDVGTVTREFTYTYDLTLSGGEPVSGDWTGDSIDNHPDFLWYPDTVVLRNPYVTVDLLQTMASSGYNENQDDVAEENDEMADAGFLVSGFIGRTLDDDWFLLDVEPSESFELRVSGNNDAVGDYMISKLYDETGTYLETLPQHIAPEDPIVKLFDADSYEQYKLELEYRLNDAFQDNYQLDIRQVGFSTVLPHVLDHFYWTNFILVGFQPVEEETGEKVLRTESAFMPMGVVEGVASPASAVPVQLQNTMYREVDLAGIYPFPEWLKLNSKTDRYRAFSFYLSEGEGSMGFLESLQPGRRILLSHIPEEDDYWWYGMVLVNPSRYQEPEVRMDLYGPDGTLRAVRDMDLSPYEKQVGVFEDFFPDLNQADISHIELNATAPIVASALYGTRNHRELSYVPGQSEMIAAGDAVFVLIDPLGYGSAGWTGLALVNGEDRNGSIYLTWHLRDGSTQSTTLPLNARSKWVGVLDDLVPGGVLVEDVVWLELLATQTPFGGFSLTGNHDLGTLVTYPFQPEFSAFKEVFPVIRRDGLISTPVLYNLQDLSANQVALIGYDENGLQVGSVHAIALDWFERKELDLSAYYSSEELDSLTTIELTRDRYFIAAYMIVKDADEVFCEIIPPSGDPYPEPEEVN